MKALHLASIRGNSKPFLMTHTEILKRIEEKIVRLGEAKRDIEVQYNRLKDENDSLYKINRELLGQIEELGEKNRELENTRSLQPGVQDDFRTSTKQRINELVLEIDECLALLNK